MIELVQYVQYYSRNVTDSAACYLFGRCYARLIYYFFTGKHFMTQIFSHEFQKQRKQSHLQLHYRGLVGFLLPWCGRHILYCIVLLSADCTACEQCRLLVLLYTVDEHKFLLPQLIISYNSVLIILNIFLQFAGIPHRMTTILYLCQLRTNPGY